MTRAPVIRDARPSERLDLEALQRRASLSNPGDREALLAHPEAIELPAWQLEQGHVRVIEEGGAVAGFAVLLSPEGGTCELDGLFVEPEAMGGGLGRALVEDAVRLARERGAARLEVVGTSHALGFYERVGFAVVGTAATRFAPALRLRRELTPPAVPPPPARARRR